MKTSTACRLLTLAGHVALATLSVTCVCSGLYLPGLALLAVLSVSAAVNS